jgi:hypothetical protein
MYEECLQGNFSSVDILREESCLGQARLMKPQVNDFWMSPRDSYISLYVWLIYIPKSIAWMQWHIGMGMVPILLWVYGKFFLKKKVRYINIKHIFLSELLLLCFRDFTFLSTVCSFFAIFPLLTRFCDICMINLWLFISCLLVSNIKESVQDIKLSHKFDYGHYFECCVGFVKPT